MKSPLLGLQKAVYDRLVGVLACGVYDAVPRGADLPYVVIGETAMIPGTAKGRWGVEVTTTFHIWSSTPGFAEVKGVIDEVLQAFDATLSIGGWVHVMSRLDLAETVMDPDGVTRHGVVRVRFLLQEAV